MNWWKHWTFDDLKRHCVTKYRWLLFILYLHKPHILYIIVLYTHWGAFFKQTQSDYGSSTLWNIFFYLLLELFWNLILIYCTTAYAYCKTNRSGNNSVATQQYTHTYYIMCIFRRRFIGYRANNTTCRVMLYIIIIYIITSQAPLRS